MSQIIGKVGITPRGMYERTRAYERLDVVTYQGSSWVAIVDVPAQISPALDSDYWQLQARMGETGPQGPVGPQGNSAFDGTGVELVNNLTQGGQTAALSAEQGKILKQELTELESKDIIVKGYITSRDISQFFMHDDSDESVTRMLKVTAGEKLVIYTDVSADDSLSAFTNAKNPLYGAEKIGEQIKLKAGYNEVVVPEGATYFGMSLKFGNTLGKPDKKIIVKSYSDTAIVGKVKALEELSEITDARLKSEYRIPFTAGIYRDTTSAHYGYEISKISELLRIPTKPITIHSVWHGAKAAYGLLFFDKDFKYVGGTNPQSVTEGQTGVFTWDSNVDIPADAKYVAIQTQSAEFYYVGEENLLTGLKYDVFVADFQRFASEQDIRDVNNKVDTSIAIKKGGWLQNDGTIAEDALSEYTDFIPTIKGEKFRFSAGTLYGGPCVYILYSLSKTPILRLVDAGVYENRTLEITSANVAYVRFSNYHYAYNSGLKVERLTEGGEVAVGLQQQMDNRFSEVWKQLTPDTIEKLEKAIVKEIGLRIEDYGLALIVDTTGSKSQYCQNTTTEVKRYRITGTMNPWINNRFVYGKSSSEPTEGVVLYDTIRDTSGAGATVDYEVTLQPNEWLFVEGYANELVVEVYNTYEKLEYIYDYIQKGNVLYGKKYAACGDSFTEGYFATLTDANGLSGKDSPEFWDAQTKSWKTYAWHIANRNNMQFYNDGRSGSSMGADYDENGNLLRWDAFANTRYKNVPKDTDYLTLMFGLNEYNREAGTKDSKDITTLWGAYNVVLEYFLTNMPYMKIGIIIPDAWESEHHRNTIIEIAKYWGIPYLDLIGDASVPMGINGRRGIEVSPKAKSLRNSAFQMTAEDSHPNPKAHLYRSTIIENFLRSL